MKIKLPIYVYDNMYAHENEEGWLDYYFDYRNFTLESIWCDKVPIKCFALPRIDYSKWDEYLDNRSLDDVKYILQQDPKQHENDGYAGFQYGILCCLKNPKVSLEDKVIKNMNEKLKQDGGKQINICVTGNATILLPSKYFKADTFCNVNLILPKGMGMYNVIDNYYSSQGDKTNTGYVVVAPKLLETKIGYKGNTKIKPIKKWQSDHIKLTYDQKKYFNRETDEIVEGNITSLDNNID